MDRHSFRAANVGSTSPKYELGKVAFSSMFLKRKKSQRFGASSLSKFHHTRQKKSLCHPWTVLQRAKKTLCNKSQFRTLFLPHRFIKIRPSHQRPVSIEFLTICRIPEFPKSEQNRKVMETCEFDGKEPLFVERTIAISIRVLGWIWKVKWQYLEDFSKKSLEKIKPFSVEFGQQMRTRCGTNSGCAQPTARKHANPLIIQIDSKQTTLSWTESHKCPVPLIMYPVVHCCSKILYL